MNDRSINNTSNSRDVEISHINKMSDIVERIERMKKFFEGRKRKSSGRFNFPIIVTIRIEGGIRAPYLDATSTKANGSRGSIQYTDGRSQSESKAT